VQNAEGIETNKRKEETKPMASVWKGSISFGLVVIPVKVSVAARSAGISFNMLHTCGSRINQKTFCPKCNKDIDRGDTMKGFEHKKGEYLTITAEELKNCEPESTRTMEIDRVVDAEDVDPMLFESSYYLEPEAAGRKGYKLLYEALTAEGKYAIARVTMSGREHIVIIRPYQGILAFHTMYFEAEVRAVPEIGTVTINAKELQLARQLLSVNAADFDHSVYADRYTEQVEELITAKQQGKKVKVMPKRETVRETDDLMAALTASLEGGQKGKKPAAATKRRSA
jgi:DNA end-binding protein Ku